MCVSLYCVCRVRTSFLSVSMESARIYIYMCVCVYAFSSRGMMESKKLLLFDLWFRCTLPTRKETGQRTANVFSITSIFLRLYR